MKIGVIGAGMISEVYLRNMIHKYSNLDVMCIAALNMENAQKRADSPEFGQMIENPNESQVSAVLKLKNGITGTFHIDTDSLVMDEAVFMIYGTKGICFSQSAGKE